ncbi:transient receptor potential channel pyrexia-like [Rhynchophorus ferrugineus]|uniref:transient receptor potential channel pyrexia-like n=1 Tax=Rhynchophorus ferrugineus TaxID=354439 RepID=UPI003FCD30A1
MADPNLSDYRKRSPLHHAVESMTSSRRHIVKLLIANGANVNATDEDGFSPLHIAALNRLPEYAAFLVEHGADLTIKCRSQATAFGIMSSRTPSAIEALYSRLDSSISEIPNREHLIHTEMQFDFKSSLHHPHEYELLNTFILEGRPDILLHPLCKAFLHITWIRLRRCYYGLIYSWIRLSLFICFYMLSAMAFQCQKENKDILYCESNVYLNTFLIDYTPSLNVQWYILVYVCTWILYSKMYDFLIYPTLKNYLLNINNQLEWVSVAGVIIVSPLYTGDIQPWQLYVGAWATLSSWTNLMFVIGQLPVFGCYVEMLQKVQNTFYKIFMTFAFFLIGYLACLCIFLPNYRAFIDISMGFTSVLVLMVGDLNYANLLNHQHLTHFSKISTYLISASFLIFITIIVMNLLIGISIDDIDSLERNAELAKIVAQLKLCLYIERSYFNRSYIFKLLFKFLRMKPKPYIGQLNIKPLDPSECQLPKHIIQQAYNIVKNQKIQVNNHSTLQYTLSMNNNDESDSNILKDIEHQIEDNLKLCSILRNDISDCKLILKSK